MKHQYGKPRGLGGRKRCLAGTLALLSALFLPAVGLTAQAKDGLDAAGILARVDSHEGASDSHSTGQIEIKDQYGLKTSGFESWSLGQDKSLLVFTSGEEKGQRILRLGDTIWVAYPEAHKPIRIRGAAMADSVAGSDLSYQDMAGQRTLASRFAPTLAGRENLGGQECTILQLQATAAGEAYPMQKIWVRSLDWTVVKAEYYSRNQRLLKTMEVLETRMVKGRTLPVRMKMTDHLKAAGFTTFQLDRMDLDTGVKATMFTVEELTW